MYLDNILITKSTDSSVSYSEILMESISTSEAVAEAEVLAVSSEFSKHVLGSEAASDWWPKIKAFFKKIWESLKRLFAKVVAWIASLPDKIVALCKKVYKMWIERGLEGKMKNLRKNIQKKIVGLNAELAKDFNDTDWGFQDPALISTTLQKVIAEVKKKDSAKVFAAEVLQGALTREIIRGAVQVSAKSYAQLNNAEDDSVSNVKESIREICEDIRTGIEEAVESEYKYEVSLANLEEWYSTIKNDSFSKEFKKASRLITVSIEIMDRLHEKAYKEFETLYKNDDEEGAKMLTLELKGYNLITQGVVYAEGFLARIYATAALNRAKMVVGVIKCFNAEGSKNGTGTSTKAAGTPASTSTKKADIVTDPADQIDTPPTPKNTPKPKPTKPAKGSAQSFISPGAMSAIIPGYNSVANDPDFAAFMKM